MRLIQASHALIRIGSEPADSARGKDHGGAALRVVVTDVFQGTAVGDVVGRWQISINKSLPRMETRGDRRQCERDFLPISIENEMIPAMVRFNREGNAP